VAIESAGVVLASDDPRGVLARAGITLAPAVGAILMSASTIVVAPNAQLLRRLDLLRT
jgi:P-type Cu2+ transporter